MCDVQFCKNKDTSCIYLGLDICHDCWENHHQGLINLSILAVDEGKAEKTPQGYAQKGRCRK